MSVEFDPTRPIYLQIVETIKRGAVRGEYAAGGQLPSVREMAGHMRVNPNTMSRAYNELEREGFIFTRRGEGSFVTEEPQHIDDERRALAKAACDRFATEIRALAMDAEQTEALVRPILEEIGHDRD